MSISKCVIFSFSGELPKEITAKTIIKIEENETFGRAQTTNLNNNNNR